MWFTESRTLRFHCTCFFVHKKQGRQRLIVDARETNRHFKRPPVVALPVRKSWLGLNAALTVASGSLLLKCGTRFTAWPSFMTYLTASLCLGAQRGSSVSASLLGSRLAVTATCGRAAGAYPWVLAGRSTAQQATTAAVVEASQKVRSSTISMRTSAWNTGAGLSVYIDNIGLIGKDREGSWAASPTSFVPEAC